MAREVWMTQWRKDHQFPVQVPLDPVEWKELVFKLPNGTEISVEIFERENGGIKIRAMDGQLIVEPEASNVVNIRTETHEERHGRS